MERVIKIENKEIFDLVSKKGELVDKGRAMAQEMEDLGKKFAEMQEELKELGGEVDAVRGEIIPLVEQAIKELDLSEYEIYENTSIEDGQLQIKVVDKMEEFKAKFIEDKKKVEEELAKKPEDLEDKD
jgi:hypothetical protein